MRCALLPLMFLWCCLRSIAEPTTQPITYHEEVRMNPPLHLFVVQVDLSDPRVSLHAVRAGEKDPDGDGPWHVTLLQTSAVARREGFDVAINANYFAAKESRKILGREIPYFSGNWAKICGWALCDGKTVSQDPGYTNLVVHQDGSVAIGHFQEFGPDVRQVVSGNPLLLIDGKIGPDVVVGDAAPRTAAGVDASGKRLTILVVDGRRPDYSAGLTATDLAKEMIRLGCVSALNLDGGGSSTLVMRDAGGRTWSVINKPSDGHGLWGDPSIERAVGFVLGAKIDTDK